MRQRWRRSPNVSPEHFLVSVQIRAHTTPHSCTFCACPPWCPTQSRTSTRSETPLVMISAPCFGRLSCWPLAPTPPCLRKVCTAAYARLHPRARGMSAAVAHPHGPTAPPAHPHRFPPPCHVAPCGDSPTHPRTAASPHHPRTHDAFSTQTPPRLPPTPSPPPPPSTPLAACTPLMVPDMRPPPPVHGRGASHLPPAPPPPLPGSASRATLAHLLPPVAP